MSPEETFVILPIKKIKKLKFEKAQFTNDGAIQLYIAREGSGSGSNGKLSDPDPAKRSGSATLTCRVRNTGTQIT